MRSRHEEMTWEEFKQLPMHPAWKYEYFGGEAHITARREAVALLRIPVEQRPPVSLPAGYAIRPPDVTRDSAALVDTFYEAFRETIEYCDWADSRVRSSAEECIGTCFLGRRGPFLPHFSRVAVTNSQAETIEAAALIVRSEDGVPHLDLLFARPAEHRRGLATAIVTDALNALYEAGEAMLSSAYHIGNIPSVRWHTRFGFVEEPDLGLALARLRTARHELTRRKEMGNLAPEEYAALEAECARLESLVNDLSAIERRDGYASVRPIYRRQQQRSQGRRHR